MTNSSGERCLTIKGTSMLPTLSEGDSVRINPDKSPSLNDIVCFRLPPLAGPFIHRVIAVKENLLLTCGDNKILPDRVITKSALLGVVEKIENFPERPLAPPQQSLFFRTLQALLIRLKFFRHHMKQRNHS